MISRLSTAALLFAASSTALMAQSLPEGTYIQGFLGYSQLQDPTFSGTINGGPQSVTSDFDSGYGIGIALGREIPQWSTGNIGTRVELELSYRESDVDGLNFTGNGPGAETNVGGDITSTSLFANVLFDFKNDGPVTPYLGLGVGATRTDIDLVYGPGVRISDDDTSFAAQAIAGVAYELNPQTSLTLDARYARAFDASAPRTAPNGSLTGNVEEDIDNFSVNLGLRFNF